MSGPRVVSCADRGALADAIADELATAIAGALGERGVAHVALSGGSSVTGAYERLGGMVGDWAAVAAPRSIVLPGGGRMSVRTFSLGRHWSPYRYDDDDAATPPQRRADPIGPGPYGVTTGPASSTHSSRSVSPS